jgi:polyphosphate kinase 2 (PPK2 family)
MGNINLSKCETRADKKIDKSDIKEETQKLREKIMLYQRMMYAEGKNSLLVVLQGMDASGKDGTVKRVFMGINPLGCQVQ